MQVTAGSETASGAGVGIGTRTCGAGGCGDERSLFGSVLALGGLFGLMASPCARAPFINAFVVVGVPLLTLMVAAPSRLGLRRELQLFARDAQATLLTALCRVVGRTREARIVVDTHRADVEAAYGVGRLAELVDADPLRLHHARRVGLFATVLAVVAGVGLPFFAGETYTFGDFPQAPFVFLTDLVVIGVTARLVTERMTIRLFEASVALAQQQHGGILRVLPMTTILGSALGAVGGLVVLAAAAGASAVESVAVFDADFGRAAFWFLRTTAPMALPLGIGIGAILGAGLGLSAPRR